jgi:hypothetical protein
MTSQKKRRKIAATVTAAAPDSQPAVGVLDTATPEDGEDLSPVIQSEIIRNDLQEGQRPAWVDGPPVTKEGRSIREKFQKPRGFMETADETDQTNQAPQEESQNSDQQRGKNWGDPYKSIFNCPEMGFELGENRRFKQRVFKFEDKPSSAILDSLKEHGFIYRAGEKTWTITANADTRKLTDEMAREWAGPNYVRGIER